MPFWHEPDYATIMEMNQVKTATEENWKAKQAVEIGRNKMGKGE